MADRIISALLRLLFAFGRVLPRFWALEIGKPIGLLGYVLAGRRRRLAMDNLRQSLGDTHSEKELRSIARRSFMNLGMAFMEYLAFPSLMGHRIDGIIDFVGEEHLRSSLDKGRGVLLLTVHLDNVDLLGIALALRGYPMGSITKNIRNVAVNRAVIMARESSGATVFAGSGNMREILQHLRNGGIVGFVLDQNALAKDGIFVPFFNREASTLSSLGVLARKTGAAVVPAYIHRTGRKHRIVIEPVMTWTPLQDKEEDVKERTKAYTLWTEKVVRRYPEQWMWIHNRWKTRPEGESIGQNPKS
ncbi:MAG: lysophospholipid acyltransferase family protein [bacterium]|nr:MAG: lysophospholipid acyltransferase family protein [bacterium]